MKFSKNAKKKYRNQSLLSLQNFNCAVRDTIWRKHNNHVTNKKIYWEIKKCARYSKKYCSGDIKQKISLFLENVLKTRSRNDGNGGPHY